MDVSRGADWGCRVDLKQAVVGMAVLGSGWVTDTVCLLLRVGGRPYGVCVCAVYRVVVDARSNRWTMINRKRPARFSWRRLVLPRGWSTTSRSEGNWRKKESAFLPFLVFPCLALPSLPALSWLGFDLEREGAGGEGFVDALCFSTGTMQCNLRLDYT